MNASYQCLFGARWRFGSSGLRLFGASGWFFGRRVAAHDGRDSNARGRGVGLKFKYAFLQIREIMDKHDGSYCTVTGAERTESLPPHMYAALGCLHPPRTRMFCAPQHTQADGSEETAPFGYVRSGFRRRAPRRRTNVPTARARRADCFEPAQIGVLRRARDCAPSCSAAHATARRGATARCATDALRQTRASTLPARQLGHDLFDHRELLRAQRLGELGEILVLVAHLDERYLEALDLRLIRRRNGRRGDQVGLHLLARGDLGLVRVLEEVREPLVLVVQRRVRRDEVLGQVLAASEREGTNVRCGEICIREK